MDIAFEGKRILVTGADRGKKTVGRCNELKDYFRFLNSLFR